VTAFVTACGATPDEHAGQETEGRSMQEGEMVMGGGSIRVTTRQAALAGVTFAAAREAAVERSLRAVAIAVPNERGLGVINARVAGWIETLYVNETGRFVGAGEPVLGLYSPELVSVQEELLLAARMGVAAGADSIRAAARRRLSLWGIAEEDIGRIVSSGEVAQQIVIRSPFTGHVLEKHVVEGQMIRPGETLFRIADLSTIWIEPAIFESDIALLRAGQRAEVTFDALPGRRFAGRVTFLHPALDARTRTLRVRVELPNRDLAVRPGMYGVVRIAATGPRGVIVPLTAVLPTGTRDLVFVMRGGDVWPTEIVVGLRGDSTVLVADGLAPGDTVIASATFLFDSESQLAAAMAGLMLNMGMGLDMGEMEMGGMEMDRERQP
jgi:Cu(I)/Ag(I) efflux system membrane fusion protein